jgi:hypothetical protein
VPKLIIPIFDTDKKKEYNIELPKESYLEKFKDNKYLLLIRQATGELDFL